VAHLQSQAGRLRQPDPHCDVAGARDVRGLLPRDRQPDARSRGVERSGLPMARLRRAGLWLTARPTGPGRVAGRAGATGDGRVGVDECVPWPFRSCAPGVQVSPVTKSAPGRSLPCRSGWFRSTPVSTIAIVAPAPRAPRDQAPVALIWPRPHWRLKSGSFGFEPVGAPPVSPPQRPGFPVAVGTKPWRRRASTAWRGSGEHRPPARSRCGA
jgi:hypothetical protein